MIWEKVRNEMKLPFVLMLRKTYDCRIVDAQIEGMMDAAEQLDGIKKIYREPVYINSSQVTVKDSAFFGCRHPYSYGMFLSGCYVEKDGELAVVRNTEKTGKS
jgi:hypothetical protein